MLGLSFNYYWISLSTSDQIYSDPEKIPLKKVALLLGTSKKNIHGNPNIFFVNRIKAAALLFRKGKIKHIIVSGDNRTEYYNEPKDMKKALIMEGVPDSCITLDFAGLRTFDSVIRCYEIFGQNSFIIISQKFHNERAVFIANHHNGINAIAFNANDISFFEEPKTFIREIFARTKCIFDIFILNTKPRFLGKKEIIPGK